MFQMMLPNAFKEEASSKTQVYKCFFVFEPVKMLLKDQDLASLPHLRMTKIMKSKQCN